MRFRSAALLFLALVLLFPQCKRKREPNRVDFEQIEIDNSNDYKYIFKERIQEDEKRDNRYREKVLESPKPDR